MVEGTPTPPGEQPPELPPRPFPFMPEQVSIMFVVHGADTVTGERVIAMVTDTIGKREVSYWHEKDLKKVIEAAQQVLSGPQLTVADQRDIEALRSGENPFQNPEPPRK